MNISTLSFYRERFIKTLVVMKLIILLIALACFKVSASVYAQTISLNEKNAPLSKVFRKIEQQSGYSFFYKNEVLKQVPKISISVKDATLSETLERCFAGLLLQYDIIDNTIIVKQKDKSVLQKVKDYLGLPVDVKGKVTDTTGAVLPGAAIHIKGSNIVYTADTNGEFTFSAQPGDELTVTYVGYIPYIFKVGDRMPFREVVLRRINNALDQVVVSTGYQTIPKERATGSFAQIDNTLFNRRVSTNILDRLENVTSGLVFNRNTLGRNEQTGITIRGRSTLDLNVNANPLIVLDNFPFEGSLDNINPNDIESVTVLKDAAAASIWGSRAGNGVIVLTSKKARYNQPLKVTLNANVTGGEKPDLYYSRDYINASTYIDVEKKLFALGFYNDDINNTISYPSLSPAVELLLRQRNGSLGTEATENQLNALKMVDARKDLDKYFYRNSLNQQYSLSIQGGNSKSSYSFSTGFDKNLSNLKGNSTNRITINTNGNFLLAKNLNLISGVTYLQNNTTVNSTNLGFGSITSTRGILQPYLRLADDAGTPLSITKNYRNSYIESTLKTGFLDWNYKPLEELNLADNTTRTSDILLRSSLNYKFLSVFDVSLQYQYERQQGDTRNHQSLLTYETRNLINIFSQRNAATGLLTYPVPKGGILGLSNSTLSSQNFRGQINYNHEISPDHEIHAIAGLELRDIKGQSYSRRSYGYDDDLGTSVTNIDYVTYLPVNPGGNFQQISAPSGDVGGSVNRYISYYANAAYTYKARYTISASGRKDGANIFGAKTNDKITPLWSTGLAWNINKEHFYNFEMLPVLKLRATYGYNGNVYNASSYLTAQYATSTRTGGRFALITSPPNESLRWERVKNINIGLDFSTKANRLSGSVEWFQKDGLDLIENITLAPTSGFYSYKGNAASTTTKGMDITLNTINLKGAFKWNSSILFSFIKDKVTRFDADYIAEQLVGSNVSDGTIEATGLFAVVGKPLYGVYSYKWAGLNSTTGDPQGYLDGQVSNDYLKILQSATVGNLVFHGSSRPTIYGSVINSFGWKALTFSANIGYKLNYYFRKRTASANLQDAINYGGTNSDFENRWQKPGDEALTNIPSVVYPSNNNRSSFYRGSEINVLKGDHIRVQDITVGYEFQRRNSAKLPFDRLYLYAYLNNIGILWRANKEGIDPDYMTRFAYPNPRTYALGFKATF